ncbi:MAG TPA: hypothetical protein VFJ58_27425 [Armatimonadota bacterium]|nr:hypothetical protein [Armatimonadota bacterium]
MNCLYWADMARRCSTLDRWTNISVAVFSSSTVASLLTGVHALSVSVSLVAAVIAITQSWHNYGGSAVDMAQIAAKFGEIELEYEMLWRSMDTETTLPRERVMSKYQELRKGEGSLTERTNKYTINNRLREKCYNTVTQRRAHFSLRAGGQ